MKGKHVVVLILCAGFIISLFAGYKTIQTWTDIQYKAHEIAEIARSMGLPEEDPIITNAQEIWWAEQNRKTSKSEKSHTPAPVSEQNDPTPPMKTTATEAEIQREKEIFENLPVEDPAISLEESEKPTRYTLGVLDYTEEDIIFVASVIYNEAGNGTSTRQKELTAGCVVNRVHYPGVGSTIKEVVCWPGQYLPAYTDYDSYYMKRAMDAENWDECLEIAERALRGEVDIPYDVIFQANFPQGRGTYETHKTSYSTSYFCYSLYTFEDPMIAARAAGLVE